MSHVIPKLNRLTLRFLLVFFCISGFLAYSYIDRTVYKTEELLIVPGNVTSEGFEGRESVLIQDVDGDALFQNFNQSNSAYIPKVAEDTVVDPVLENTNPSVESDTQNEATEDNATDGAAATEEVPESSDVAPVPTDEAASQEQAAPEINDQSAPAETEAYLHNVRFLVTTSTEKFPWAQSDETVVIEDVSESYEDIQTPASENPESLDADNDSAIVESEDVDGNASGDEVLEVLNEDSTVSDVSEDEESLPVEAPVTNDNFNLFGLEPCLSEQGCSSKALIFDNFSMPEFVSGTRLDSVELRLSLAAKAKSGSAIQRFVVSYSTDSGVTYNPGTVIDVDGEISNSINGDYFMVALDIPPYTQDLSQLKVKVVYEGIDSEREEAFVDGVWLDVTSGSFYEESEFASSTDAIDYTRELDLPEFNDSMSPDFDVTLGSVPEFTFEYQMQSNFFKRIFTAIFSENTFAISNVRLEHEMYGNLDVPFEVVYHEDNVWTLKLPNTPQKMQPGKYKAVVTIAENDTYYEDSFEFYWGVLAVNTKKTRYAPNEEVVFNLAALTDKGDTICDANLVLQVKTPSNTFFDVPVNQSGSCGENNVTDIPDYLASFRDTNEIGLYSIVLSHINKSGEVVHKIQDSFEVAEFVPYDIERTAPTRIYPPALYEVKLNITANRSYEGDIVERVPRGFIIEDLSKDALIETLPDVTLIKWPNVSLKEGDKLELSYKFDAPDISPYMYLLGPLAMDGYEELRAWQIASDALSGIGWFTGTRTVAGTNLDSTASPLQWSTSSIDNYYFEHSTSTDNERVIVRQPGDYLLALSLPVSRTDGNNSRVRIGAKVRVNGVVVPEGVGQSAYTRNQNGHTQSSDNLHFLLTDLQPDDYIEVYAEALTTVTGSNVVNISGNAGLYLEHIGDTDFAFAATTTRTVASTNLNRTASSALMWTETRQDTGFVHSNTINPEQITISNPGTYLVHVNVPLQGDTAGQNVAGRVWLNGAPVPGGFFAQGYLAGPAASSDGDSSIHWSGIVVATTTNQILTVTTELESAAGTTSVPTGFAGTIFIQQMPSTDVFVAMGVRMVGGTNWNAAGDDPVQWVTSIAKDAAVFTHSTTTNSHQVTVNEAGDYVVVLNTTGRSATGNVNNNVLVKVNGVTVPGAQTSSGYIAGGAHDDSSNALTYLLTGLATSSVITVTTAREAAAGTIDDIIDATLMMWKKLDFNERPTAPTYFNTPFDNVRFASTTPYFDFEASDPDGASDLQYEFAISTSSDFASSTTRVSGVDSGFSNTASSSDIAPFVENNKIRFQLQPGDQLTDLTTYYWRVRARDVSGSNKYGDWSTTQSLTVDLGAASFYWFQTTGSQFSTNVLVGTISSASNGVVVDAADNTEILIAYGEGTVTTPRYRMWTGSGWGIEQNAVAVGGTINWVQTAAAVNRDEYTMITLDASGSSYAQIYQASTSAWGNQVLVASGVTGPQYRGVAVAYESLSGDAVVVSCGAGPDPVYRVWNGTSWSATSTINAASLNNCNYVTLASDPASDEIIVVTRDTGTQYEALVWDGSNWTNGKVLGSSPVVTRQGMAVAYEASGDQAVVVTANGTNNNFLYSTWNGTEWSANTTQAVGNDFSEARLAKDVNSDELLLCYVDADSDTGVLRWDGGVWSTFTELETSSNGAAARSFDCEFESVPGRSNYSIITYSDTVGVRYRTATSTVWATEASVDVVQDSYWVQTERADDGTIVAVSLDDVADDYISSYWNGSTWSTNEVIETNPSSVIAAPYEPFHMSAKRYQFTQGTVTTPPISFSTVPNQPTWGDITFSATEPFGTDVLVRVKYTSTTTCDSNVPDGVLVGNAAGFSVDDLPINISGLSTTTYNQLCLEASITTLGSDSASLDDWELSWVRQPKLLQSAYRWYVNGSFLTPTDPWPLGLEDLTESAVINSSRPVNSGDVLRLRLAIEGSNVAMSTSSKMFKLQYAEAPSCTLATDWFDVGQTGSTTALWRGYANSVLGSDWYSASWPKRIKISVDNAMASGSDLTNFPVYVNLDDLPTAFFDSVQSDGDDIRVTASDGVTEVPIEVVSIDTGSDIGEVYFRASSISTTTDTDFYIYYGNPSVSGYSVSSTYGRNNVWSNNYAAVYHMNNVGTTIVDSTGNNLTGTKGPATAAPTEVVSPRGRAQFCDGNDYIEFGDVLDVGNRNWSIATWYQPTTAGALNSSILYNKENSYEASAGGGYHTYAWQPHWNWDGGTSFTTASGTWAYAVVTYNHASQVMYKNGLNVYSRAQTGDMNSNSEQLQFCARGNTGHSSFFTGNLDDLRMSSTSRSAGWIYTEYNNQSNPTGFYSVSAEEIITDGRVLPTKLLTQSDKSETYEENNPTILNRFALPVGDASEWDFVLENNGAAVNANYCFRAVYNDNAKLSAYSVYPQVRTNGAPLAATLDAPFDNEQLASTTPWFEFTAADEAGDVVSYEIQVDDDYAFLSPEINRESNANFSEFTNLQNAAERGQYTNGQVMRFVPTTALTSGTTYYWRVRAKDDLGSNTQGEWSTIYSFTVNTGTTITTWHQTTGEQFAVNNLEQLLVSTSTDDVRIDTGLTVGTTTSSVIDFDDKDTGNAWGNLLFTQNITSGTIRYYVEYKVSGENFALVPDGVLSGNSSGFTASPVSLAAVNPESYNELRIRVVFSGNDSFPRLQDLSVTWGLTIEEPEHQDPFDNAKVSTTTPPLTFVTSDPQGQDLQYEVQISTTSDFTSSSTFMSGVDSGFINTQNGGDTSPFTSGNIIRYTPQSALTNGQTYWWRTRARDPFGSNAWSDYSDAESFTVDTAITVSVWHQTTGQQFSTNLLTDIETTSGGAQITSIVRGVMMAYGEGTGQSPRYRMWDGSAWGAAETALSVGASLRWLQLVAAPTRPEYALATIGTDNDVNIQIFNSTTETWGNLFGLENNITNIAKSGFGVAYESNSGDLIAVACSGVDAVYSVWNGSTWSATSTINLANANNCNWIELASDPTSDEIVALFRHTNTNYPDSEALVWNGTSWGNSLTFSEQNEDTYPGLAVAYEESGGQAIVVGSNNLATDLVYSTWNGSTWLATSSATGTTPLGDHIEWATLRPDVGSDKIALCYIDNDGNIGVKIWDGSAWGTFTEIEQTGNSKAGQAVDCAYETTGSRDGYLMVPYSDNGPGGVGDGGKYQFFATTTPSGELDLSTIEDSWRVLAVRAADGIIHTIYFDDVNDRWSVTNWDGSTWQPFFNITNPPTTGTPFDGYLTMAAQIYPNFTLGTIESTDIDFDDGSGPRWERIVWNDTTPGSSEVRYRVYYQATSSAFVLVPDSALSGNAAGFTTSPVSIAGLDRTIYAVLRLEAELICVSGSCPTVEDWSLEWSEGISVSGRAYEYAGATTTSGTVAVVVNGVLQSGKTAVIQPDGTWSIANVPAFEGDSILVYVDGAADQDESIGYTTYDGVGDVTNMELTKRHLTVGSSDTATTSNILAFGYDYTDDEDIFIDISASGEFDLCVSGCVDSRLVIKTGAIYAPSANVTTHDFVNRGNFKAGTSTVRIGGSFSDLGTFAAEASTVIMTATTSVETLTTATSSLWFNNLTLGETSGAALFNVDKSIDIDGNLRVDFGTFGRGTSSIAVARDLFIGIGGTMSGLGTTTFDGGTSALWTDQSASSTNVGHVVIDGVTKTVTLGSAATANSVTIGSDDTLNASGSGFNLNVYKNWTNNNLFVPQGGTVTFVGTSTGVIARGSSAFNNLAFTGVGGVWSFSTSTLALNGNFTVATGTVTLPTGTTTIGGSFINTGGAFAHNNGEVRMTSTAGGRTIATLGTLFLNSFYDLTFSGSGAWSFTDAATTTRNMRISAGSVTMPASTLTVGGDFTVTGSGSFNHNNGEVKFAVSAANTISANNSAFNNVRTIGGSAAWYSTDWQYRVAISVQEEKINSTLSNFPVYVNLANLPAAFFSNVNASGTDIRVTTADGVTELPREVVFVSTSTSAGELYFKANTLSSTTDTTFFLYFGNALAANYASSSTFGSQNVWTNGYAGVWHMNDASGTTIIDSTANSYTGTKGAAAAAPTQVVSQMGYAQSFDGGDYIDLGNVLSPGASDWTITTWHKPTAVGTSQGGILYNKENIYEASAGGNNHQYAWMPSWVWYDGTGAAFPTVVGSWYHAAVVYDHVNQRMYKNGTSVYSRAQAGNIGTGTSRLQFGARGDTGHNTFFTGHIDEIRMSSAARSADWLSAEFANQSTTTDFYSVGGNEAQFRRIFSDATTTILGNYVAEAGGNTRFSTGVLLVGGSFDNNALFDANNGTVRFNSTSGAETIAAGASSFATLDFNATSGDFTIVENATSTVAISLTNANQFTLQSGVMLSALGTFNQVMSGTSTTWTGSTLRLLGTDQTIHTKSFAGDTYGTIEAQNDTDIALWNSNATNFSALGTASFYSQDHAGNDGDLYIYGNYIRATGTEYWSYGNDFDGASLGSGRQVDVRIASSSSVGFASSSLNITGSSTASTTIAAISGSYAINATNTTVTASSFTMAGAGTSGFGLLASSTLTTFSDAYFEVLPGRTAITMDGSTINKNPTKQLERISFATTTPGSASNVTFTGTSTSFVWFRNGYGNLYGEAYDAGDGNPGAVRFDDSSYLINVSGRVLTNDGGLAQGAPVCDGVTANVRLVVNSGSYTAQTTCNATTGAYSFSNVAFVGDPKITVYLNTNGGIPGAVVTKTPTGDISNLDIYTYEVMLRHEGASPITIADLTQFNVASDTDLRFIATTTPAAELLVYPGSGLVVAASSTFAPGGNITLTGNASSSPYEGSLKLATSSSFVAAGTETHTLSGRLVVGQSAILTPASSTFAFVATTTGKSITSSSTVTLHNLTFAGVGGAWHITAPLSVSGDMSVAAGTVTGTSNITLVNGQLTGNGTLSLGGGTVTINHTNVLGGTSPWTFSNLTLGSGSLVGTTTLASTATTTVSGLLTVANAHTFAPGSAVVDLSGSGTVFTVNGSFVPGTGLVRYSGNNATVLGSTYYDLSVGAVSGSSTFTGNGVGLLVQRNLVVGNGTASSTFNLNTSDPVFTVTGDVTVYSLSTLSLSNLSTTTMSGNFDNNGTVLANGGAVLFNGSGSNNLAFGNSALARVLVDGTGSYTLIESATTTNSLILENHTSFTVATSATLAVAGNFENRLAGGATNFSGALHIFGGGSLSINPKSTSESYSVFSVASGTRVRTWNSDASVYSIDGGLYSQDHAGTDGLLNIYGTFIETSSNDHWSYEYDFDGTSLSGGSERQVTVAFAAGSSVSYTGGALSVIGSPTASTSLQNQGSGNYSLSIGGSASTSFNAVTLRNLNASGIVFTGAPTVNDFSSTDHLVQENSGSGITVGGTVINANEAKNFTNNSFAAAGGVTGAINVTATGTAISSWRFTNHIGALSGEANDNDPTGDPGYLVWDDSAALITVSGNVYSDEGVTVSGVCDGSTNNIVLRVAGLTSYTTSCNATTGAYSLSGVAFNSLDSLVLYIDGETEKAAHITKSPISSISGMHLYENRVIVRHENTAPINIDDMAVWDSSDDADIPFTAVSGAPDTLTLGANKKLIIWTGKTFAPGGNVTLSGGGLGNAVDGTLEAYANSRFRVTGGESHSIAGNFVFGTAAVFESGSGTTTFTSNVSGRTIDVNENNFHNLSFTGSGSWTVLDNNLTTNRSLVQSAGTVTFGSGTTTVGGSFNVTGGSFGMNGSALVFNSSSTGNTVRFNGSSVPTTTFSGALGSWSMTDTNATTTGSLYITNTGTVTLPSGSIAVGGSFINASGTVTHNTADIVMTGSGSNQLQARGSDLFALRKIGAGSLTVLDASITFRDDVLVNVGNLVMATGTTAIGGSFTVTGGSFNHSSGTVLFNAVSTGKTISASTSAFYNVNFGSASGGWTWLQNATTSNDLTLTTANTFVKESGTILNVGGVFTNLVGGAATTWTNTVLKLTNPSAYTINTKLSGGDTYDTVEVTAADLRVWNSSMATTTLGTLASVYSQDNAAIDGNLYIYGDFTVSTTTEYWSYATDFDGAVLSGLQQRAVLVKMANNATTSVQSGTLNIVGSPSATTTIGIIGTGTHAMSVSGGTLNAQYYRFEALNAAGLSLSGTPTISNLSNGFYHLVVNSGTLLAVTASALDANASKIFTSVGFNASSGFSGVNVSLTGSTTNAWRFSGSYGSLGGEAFDIDGIDACGSIRFDNSACLLTAQTSFRWRNDDGGEGVPASEWFNTSWDYRQRVRFENTTGVSYGTTTLKVVLPYDSSMQSDFDDLRFTLQDGVTPADYWIEKYTASTEAVVWVEVPNFNANAYTTVFAYYGNVGATSSSSGATTLDFIDDFEDNNITEYSGDTGLFQTDTAPVYGGTYALEALNKSGRTTDGIYRTGSQTAQGKIIRWRQYVDTSVGGGDEGCTLFGVQANQNLNYAVCFELYGTDRVALSKDVDDNDVSGTVLASTTLTYTTGWYEVEVDWQTNNRMDVYVYNPSGNLVATTTAVDSSYTTGGLGYTFWIQNGAWDSYTVRNRAAINPPVTLGVKQTDGGATWASTENAMGSGLPDVTKRLRIGIENSGLTVSGHTYKLQYAAKGVAPSCEAVSSGSYATVPNQSSCGSSPVCMQTSTNVADSDNTTDLLTTLAGTFTSGKVVENPSNTAGALTITQDYYTEVEYVITPTLNASDAYCFRVINDTTPLDYYGEVAELGLQFDPTLGTVNFNNGLPIVLTPNATTTVYATSTVTDFNGYLDIVSATSTIYRSGVGPSCAADVNNCYISSTGAGCMFTNCSGNTCVVECRSDIYFHADPTDASTYEGEEWLAYLEVSDTSAGYDMASALGIELLTLRALNVDSAINYGALAPEDNTGSYNATTTIANTGNVPFDIEVEGTDLSDGGSSIIPADKQKFATSTFSYSACATCSLLSSSTAVELAVNLAKPVTASPAVTTPIYWGVEVPFGVNSAPHQGINLFTPVTP